MKTNPYQPPSEANRNQGIGLRLPFVAMHALIAIALGSVFVIVVLPLHLFVAGAWLATLGDVARRHFKNGRPEWGRAAIAIQSVVLAAVILAAHIAPVKTVDKVREQSVVLPKIEMTLTELHEYAEGVVAQRPRFVTGMMEPGAEALETVRFPARRITLGQFVESIEDQSRYHGRYSHCGNGWTVLWGGDCSFGLYLSRRDP
jgi:hypothetical protein